MVGLAFVKAAKQPFFPFQWKCPVVSQPVRACQLIKAPDLSGPSLSYIRCRNTLCRISLVPMITAERSSRSGVLRSAKSSTSVYCEYMLTFIPLLATVTAEESLPLLCADTGHCFTFLICHNCMSCCSHNFDGTLADELMGKIVR